MEMFKLFDRCYHSRQTNSGVRGRDLTTNDLPGVLNLVVHLIRFKKDVAELLSPQEE